ncbi:MAG TPA: carboxymuconolactone decarboxylase family protein [Candidatus Thermoplasmatota archaeon]|nr:carboxymuconolactone decarboxylase family protein [Candidatus Thermoplasmatota archaeon]
MAPASPATPTLQPSPPADKPARPGEGVGLPTAPNGAGAHAADAHVHVLRLAPVDHPKGLKLRLIYWLGRKRFGVVPTPLKVVAPRFPPIARLSMALQSFDRSLRLPKELRLLVSALVSGTNGCGFCLDLKHMMAVDEGLTLARFHALPGWRSSTLFTARERAALQYAEEVTLHRQPQNATFEALRKHFREEEIVELTFVIALENFYNLSNVPLGIGSDGLCALAQARRR